MSQRAKGTLGEALRSVVKGLREFAYATRIPTSPSFARPRIGLALSGGFARGLAHIGVLKALSENKIPIDAIAGTSVGSVVGAAFASGSDVKEMLEAAREVRWSTFARWTIARLGLATNLRMEEMLRRVLRCSTFEELSVPLAVVTTDLSTGECVVFRKGDLIPPLRASCSFPGLFTPVAYQGHLLVDGAICNNLPVDALLNSGLDAIIAVHLKGDGLQHTPTNMFEVIGQAFQIAERQHEAGWRQHCDVVIEPDVRDFRWDDFGRCNDLILAGERAAIKALPALRSLLTAHADKTVRKIGLLERRA